MKNLNKITYELVVLNAFLSLIFHSSNRHKPELIQLQKQTMNFPKKLVKQVKRSGTGVSENATYCCGKSNGKANLAENMNRR